MKYEIKNISGSVINIGDISINNNDSYIIKKSNKLNKNINDIVLDIEGVGVLNQHIYNNDIEFYIDDILQTQEDFFTYTTKLVNKEYYDHINNISNSYQLSFCTLDQVSWDSVGLAKTIISKKQKLTTNGDIGYGYGDLEPHLIPKDCIIKSIRMTTASCAVSNNKVDPIVILKLRLWKINPLNRVKIGDDIDFELSSDGVNIWSNVGDLHEKTSFIDNLYYYIDGGSMVGLEFVNIPKDSSGINAINKLFVSLEIEE